MGLNYRKRVKVGKTASLNFSGSGVSASKRFGRVTINSRGRISIRLWKGFNWRIN